MNTRLSICIPTFNRCDLLRVTLESFLPQVASLSIPIYVTDNASTDGTAAMLAQFQRDRYPHLYFKSQSENIGFDRNLRSVVELAGTEFCWLFSDDDLPVEGAIGAILAYLERNVSFVVLNSSAYLADMSTEVAHSRLTFSTDRFYGAGEHSRLLADTGQNVCALATMIVNRDLWLKAADAYYPRNFGHIGASFVSVLGRSSLATGRPLVKLRMPPVPLSPSAKFEFQMISWPEAIWGLPPSYSDAAKKTVAIRGRASSLPCVVAARSLGMYDGDIFRRFLATDQRLTPVRRFLLRLVSSTPKAVCDAISIAFLLAIRPRGYQVVLGDIREVNAYRRKS